MFKGCLPVKENPNRFYEPKLFAGKPGTCPQSVVGTLQPDFWQPLKNAQVAGHDLGTFLPRKEICSTTNRRIFALNFFAKRNWKRKYEAGG
jgi:hypothetical protein